MIFISRSTTTGGFALKMLPESEKSSNGNQIMKTRTTRIRPPRPYLTTGLLGLPRGVGYFWNKVKTVVIEIPSTHNDSR